MHNNRSLIEERLDRFTQQVLPAALYRETRALTVELWEAPGEPVPFDEAKHAHYEPAALPQRWGAPWSTSWLRVAGTVPPEWLTDGAVPAGLRLELVIDLGFYGDRPGFQSEGLVYAADGTMLKGIAPRSGYVPWQPTDTAINVFVEAAANPDVAGTYTYAPTPLGDLATAGTDPLYELRRVDVALLDVEVWELAQDVWALDGLMRELDPSRSRRWEILRALERMLDAVDPDDVAGTAHAGRGILAEALSRPAEPSAHQVVAIGHAHIDSAWLWPVRETIRKCARTFTSMISLMDQDPEFRFACSSAQQLYWMKVHYPELYERIREKVAGGQFIPVGGMWIEPDMNMPGGEAMARQLVAGKKFFQEEFGVDCLEAWVPDTFGYSAAVPQVLVAAGMRWFMTQKISWNQTNEMPHTSFLWEGIDGTRIFTHFPSADTYISELSAAELAHAERNFKEKGDASLSMIPFGWGDGGGGPTREMLAAAKRVRSLEGSPTVEIDSPQTFFERAEREVQEPPVWSGELYLELHRGSLTSQHLTKQGNRRSEHLMREAELWAATAAVRLGVPYPYDELEQSWHTVLLNQFHDILPGTSIAWVHREVEESYAALEATVSAIIDERLAALVGDGNHQYLANAAPASRSGVPGLGIDRAAEPDTPEPTVSRLGDAHVIDNGLLRAVIDQGGHLTSLRDSGSGREAIAPGAVGNQLRFHRDKPSKWDAWDVDEHYRRVVETEADTCTVEPLDEPDAAGVVVTKAFGPSVVRQTIRIERGGSSLRVVNEIDWHHRDTLLKLAFPLDVHADRFASETQFGHVFRPTHTNTSWDAARFEVCAHRWIHVGETGYGIAIANESTYGHSVERETRTDGGTTTTVGLSLLRGPRFPDPDADVGQHTITYDIRPGSEISDAVALGYGLNLPPRRVQGGRAVPSIVSVSHPGVVVESVKLAEDRSGDVVVRLYEAEGARSAVTVTTGFPASGARFTDLLERDSETVQGAHLESGAASFVLRPFQLVTLRFTRAVAEPGGDVPDRSDFNQES